MKFTLVFPSQESSDLSVGGLFSPCFGWQIKGKNHFPHPNYPHYRTGDFQFLIDLLSNNQPNFELSKRVVLVIHRNGHGTSVDAENLKVEARLIGYQVTEVAF